MHHPFVCGDEMTIHQHYHKIRPHPKYNTQKLKSPDYSHRYDIADYEFDVIPHISYPTRGRQRREISPKPL
jgi:hypothetical protein